MIPRRKPLRRSTKPLKRSPLARNRAAIPSRRAKPRRGPADIPANEWRAPGYRKWLRETQACLACAVMIRNPEIQPGVTLAQLTPGRFPGYCDPCHTENGGMRMKGRDSSCVPLCRGFGTLDHHRHYDANRKAFTALFGLDMHAESAQKWQEWTEFVT